MKSSLPLQGIRVLDLSRVLAGPYAAMILADLGADVVKLEQPGRGDETRAWGPPFAEDGNSAYFMCANRNKSLVRINLKIESERSDFERLVRSSDVVIHNFTPAVAQSLRLGDADIRALNPEVIIAAISGYGHGNDYSDQPGYDFLVQAMSGLMSITGEVGSVPTKLGVAITDIVSGLYAVIGILASLYSRESGGKAARKIDISLMQAAVASLVNVGQSYLVSGRSPVRFGNAHPQIVPYELFPTQDSYLALAVGNDEQFRRLCSALESGHLSSDPLYASNPTRVQNRGSLIAKLTEIFRTKSTEDWITIIRQADVPVGPVLRVDEILASDWAKQRAVICTDELGNQHLQSPLATSFDMPARVRSAPTHKD